MPSTRPVSPEGLRQQQSWTGQRPSQVFPCPGRGPEGVASSGGPVALQDGLETSSFLLKTGHREQDVHSWVCGDQERSQGH